eukprot:45256-Eustigmatos_ZCMA.PRE.1
MLPTRGGSTWTPDSLIQRERSITAHTRTQPERYTYTRAPSSSVHAYRIYVRVNSRLTRRLEAYTAYNHAGVDAHTHGETAEVDLSAYAWVETGHSTHFPPLASSEIGTHAHTHVRHISC